MSGRPDRFNRNPPAWNNSWGQTTTENPTLLVYVSNIPAIATLDEYRQFFEKSGKVVGINLSNYRAIIKFERPFQADHAISRTLENFKGREIIIERYRLSKNNGRVRSERSHLEQAMLGTTGYTRHQKRSRSANRTRSRSRSPSPSRWRYRQSSAFVNRPTPVQDTSIYGNPSTLNYINRAPPPEESSWLAQRESSLPQLPPQIKNLLNLMLIENTARTLSFPQIQTLTNFLEHEKEFVWGPALEQRQQPTEVDQPSDSEPLSGTPQEVQADANMVQDEPEPYESEVEEENDDDKILEMLAEATGRSS